MGKTVSLLLVPVSVSNGFDSICPGRFFADTTVWLAMVRILAVFDISQLKDADGNVLHPRPHWAKQWKGLVIHNKEVENYFKEDAYKQAFADFRQAFEAIVTKRGSTVDETLKRYGNDTMKRLIWQ